VEREVLAVQQQCSTLLGLTTRQLMSQHVVEEMAGSAMIQNLAASHEWIEFV
jgi:hypothetical protein